MVVLLSVMNCTLQPSNKSVIARLRYDLNRNESTDWFLLRSLGYQTVRSFFQLGSVVLTRSNWIARCETTQCSSLIAALLWIRTGKSSLRTLIWLMDPCLSSTHEEATVSLILDESLPASELTIFQAFRLTFDFFPRKFAACLKPPSKR